MFYVVRVDSIVVGATKQLDDFNTQSTLEDTVNILSGASRLIPSIKVRNYH